MSAVLPLSFTLQIIYFIIFRARTKGTPGAILSAGIYFYYNETMEQLSSILLGLALLYVFYILIAGKWDYASQAKNAELKEQLKEQGLSVRYYFIPAGRLLLFNILSGGLFLFYWIYKQWQAVLSGYKNSAGTPLKYGPVLRTLFAFISFYQLNAITNRTCLYMHKRPTLSHWFWGTALWAGLAAAWTPVLPPEWRILGGVLFIIAPSVLQRRINALPKELPPFRLKLAEILWLIVCWIFLAACWRVLAHQGIL